MINFKKKTINGKMYNVIDMETCMKNNDIYDKSQTAVEVSIDGNNYVLPFRNKTDTKPGIYEDGVQQDDSPLALQLHSQPPESLFRQSPQHSGKGTRRLCAGRHSTRLRIRSNPEGLPQLHEGPLQQPSVRVFYN